MKRLFRLALVHHALNRAVLTWVTAPAFRGPSGHASALTVLPDAGGPPEPVDATTELMLRGLVCAPFILGSELVPWGFWAVTGRGIGAAWFAGTIAGPRPPRTRLAAALRAARDDRPPETTRAHGGPSPEIT